MLVARGAFLVMYDRARSVRLWTAPWPCMRWETEYPSGGTTPCHRSTPLLSSYPGLHPHLIAAAEARRTQQQRSTCADLDLQDASASATNYVLLCSKRISATDREVLFNSVLTAAATQAHKHVTPLAFILKAV